MEFHRFFTAAMRNPRVALMTGRSAVAARMTRSSSPLPREEGSSPELLRGKGGYSSGVCGRSFHLDGPAGTLRPWTASLDGTICILFMTASTT